MSKVKTIEQLFTDFINQLKLRNRISLQPFDQQKWFQGAYSTIQRTLRKEFKPLSRDEKATCAKLLFSEIPLLSGQNFDVNLKNLILQIATEFNVSIGHAQKLISILAKYAAACHGEIPQDWKSLIHSEFERLPVPIDAIVLFQLKDRYPEMFCDIIAGSGMDTEKRLTYWARVAEQNTTVSWSRISDYKTYWSLQERIRKLAKAENLAPLEFEMRHLWV